MFVEPYKMTNPQRGDLTSETLIQIQWAEIIADSLETGGAQIDSYNLQWMVKDSADPWSDLVG